MPESEDEEGNLPSDLLKGWEYRLEHWTLDFLITSYKSMYEEVRFNEQWKENTFSAVLTSYLKRHRQNFCKQTLQNWHIVREEYNDDALITSGQGDPDKATRIDIVVYTWSKDYNEVRFPFECKLLDEENTDLTRFYIKKGLVDRYLTDKNYARESSWGGMIGYILRGSHDRIITKLNAQIDHQLQDSTHHLKMEKPIEHQGAIYKSQHQRSEGTDLLTITHILLPFCAETKIEITTSPDSRQRAL